MLEQAGQLAGIPELCGVLFRHTVVGAVRDVGLLKPSYAGVVS